MKAALLACVLLGLTCQTFAEEFEQGMVDESGARFLYFNSSSSATSLSLLGALILLGVIGYLVFASGLIGGSAYNRNDYHSGAYGQYDQYDQQGFSEYRSANDGLFSNQLNILTWISMLRDAYEQFDYNDLDCQKKLICEVMREPEYYGTVARKFKTGFQYAKYLNILQLPDDLRELLDEYEDANATSDSQKDCDEFYSCPYSIKNSMKNSVNGL